MNSTTTAAKPGVLGEFSKPVYARAERDWYVESREDALAFLQAERFTGSIWDPACGGGNIPQLFLDHFDTNNHVFGSDIVHRGWKRTVIHDFLGDGVRADGMLAAALGDGIIDNIVCNPPYRTPKGAVKDLGWQFVEKALAIARHKVAILHGVAWGIEGIGDKRRPARAYWLDDQPLARVWAYPWRVNMPPGEALRDGTVKRGGGMRGYAWFVFEHGWRGPPQLLRLRKPVVDVARAA